MEKKYGGIVRKIMKIWSQLIKSSETVAKKTCKVSYCCLLLTLLVVYVMAWIKSFPNNWMYLPTYSQTVGLFGKVKKTLRVVALLEEVYHRGELWDCIHNSTSGTLFSLCMNEDLIKKFLLPWLPWVSPQLPIHDQLCPFGTKSQSKYLSCFD